MYGGHRESRDKIWEFVHKEGHNSLYLSSYYNGKTRLDFVPKAYKDAVSQCIKDYEDIIALLTEFGSINLELFRCREIDF